MIIIDILLAVEERPTIARGETQLDCLLLRRGEDSALAQTRPILNGLRIVAVVVANIPAAQARQVDRYRQPVTGLIAAMRDKETAADVIDIVRSLVGKIILLNLDGDLTGIIKIASGK